MAYLCEALKLDVRSLMATAMKGGKQSAYSITISCPTGQVICRDLRDSPDRVATVTITVNWPTKAGEAVSGGILLNYRGWDDRAAEQTVISAARRPKSAAGCGGSAVLKRGNRFQRFIWRQTATGFYRARRSA
jgi:hypothetical protein